MLFCHNCGKFESEFSLENTTLLHTWKKCVDYRQMSFLAQTWVRHCWARSGSDHIPTNKPVQSLFGTGPRPVNILGVVVLVCTWEWLLCSDLLKQITPTGKWTRVWFNWEKTKKNKKKHKQAGLKTSLKLNPRFPQLDFFLLTWGQMQERYVNNESSRQLEEFSSYSKSTWRL